MLVPELVARGGAVQVVDVRWPNEWEAGRIEGSVHMPLDDLEERYRELDRGRPVVTVCRSGNRSATAARHLEAEGFVAESLEGGLEAWVAEGRALVAADGSQGSVVDAQPPADDRPAEHQRLEAELLSVLFAVQAHFGDREPSDEEVRGFLRQRLIDEGRSEAEADRFMASLDGPG